MKKILIISLLISSIVLSAQNVDLEKEAIKKVIQTAYVEGLQNEGDTIKINSGIHQGFNLLGIGENNTMWTYPINDWKTSVIKKKNDGAFPRTDDDKISIKFKNIDITGTAAVAKIEFFVGDRLTFVDYISLYKFSDGWKMVNKIFYKFE